MIRLLASVSLAALIAVAPSGKLVPAAEAKALEPGAAIAIGEICDELSDSGQSLVGAAQVSHDKPYFYDKLNTIIEVGFSSIGRILKLNAAKTDPEVGGDVALGYARLGIGSIEAANFAHSSGLEITGMLGFVIEMHVACKRTISSKSLVYPASYPYGDH